MTGIRRPRKALTAKQVQNEKMPGKYHDGNGLYLLVKKTGTKQWVQRIQYQGKRHELGLGSAINPDF